MTSISTISHWRNVLIMAGLVVMTGESGHAQLAQSNAAPRPWSASASSKVAAEDISIAVKDATLSGTLYIPLRKRPVAAVVVTHAAFSPLRSSPLYIHLKTVLPALGIAVFIYDRRASGQSTGASSGGDFTVLADDAVAATQRLARDPRVDPKRVGIWGLSQGGWLALLAASRSQDVRFAVSISAPIVTPDVQMMFSSTNTLRVFGFGPTDIDQMQAARKAVDDYMRGKDTRSHAQSLVDAASTKPWFKYLYMGKTVSSRETSGWAKEIRLDPIGILDKVKVPTLMLYGAADPVVPVATSVERLDASATRHPNIIVHVVAGADHGMQMAVDPKDLLDPAKVDFARPDSQEYIAVLASWLTRMRLADRVTE